MKTPLFLSPLHSILVVLICISAQADVFADSLVADPELSGWVKGDQGTEVFGGGTDSRGAGWNYFEKGRPGLGDNENNNIFAQVLAFRVTPEWIEAWRKGKETILSFERRAIAGGGTPGPVSVFLLDINDGQTTSAGKNVAEGDREVWGLGRVVANASPLVPEPIGNIAGREPGLAELSIGAALCSPDLLPIETGSVIWLGLTAGTNGNGITEVLQVLSPMLTVNDE